MIAAGKYTAKARGIRFIGKKQGFLAVEVAFKFKDDQDKEQILPWQGFLKNKQGGTDAMEGTMKRLFEVMEFDGSQDVVNVPEGDPKEGMLVNQDCINRTKDYSIEIEIETNTDDKGKTYNNPKIKWVNNLGGGKFSGLSKEVVDNELGAIGFKAMFLAIAKNAPGTPVKQPEPQKQITESDIPW